MFWIIQNTYSWWSWIILHNFDSSRIKIRRVSLRHEVNTREVGIRLHVGANSEIAYENREEFLLLKITGWNDTEFFVLTKIERTIAKSWWNNKSTYDSNEKSKQHFRFIRKN